MKDTLKKIKGHVVVEVIRADGTKLVKESDNLFTNVGYQSIFKSFNADESYNISAIACGTGTNTPNLNDQSLTNPTYVPISGSEVSTSLFVLARFGENDAVGKVIKEFGLMNGNSKTVARVLLDPLNGVAKTNSDIINISWTLQWNT